LDRAATSRRESAEFARTPSACVCKRKKIMFVTPAARRARNKILTRRAETFGHVAEFGQILERSDANYSGGKFAAGLLLGLAALHIKLGAF
jgi:hypothetical protein